MHTGSILDSTPEGDKHDRVCMNTTILNVVCLQIKEPNFIETSARNLLPKASKDDNLQQIASGKSHRSFAGHDTLVAGDSYVTTSNR
eukprot:2627803-Amphidinium_carterae.1